MNLGLYNLKEKHKLKVFGYKTLREIHDPEGIKVVHEEKRVKRNLMIYIAHFSR
jgi:hypothetical protein